MYPLIGLLLNFTMLKILFFMPSIKIPLLFIAGIALCLILSFNFSKAKNFSLGAYFAK